MSKRLTEDEKNSRKIARYLNPVSQKGFPKVFRVCAFPGCTVTKRAYGDSVTAKKSYCSNAHRIGDAKLLGFRLPCAVCGLAIRVVPSVVKFKRRSTCSPKCRRALAKARSMSRSVGYTRHQTDRNARYSVESIEWRKAVFERDDYTCQMCKTRGGYLEADHIKPWAYFVSLRFDLSNGRTLCRACHDSTKMSYKKMREIYGAKKVDKKD